MCVYIYIHIYKYIYTYIHISNKVEGTKLLNEFTKNIHVVTTSFTLRAIFRRQLILYETHIIIYIHMAKAIQN